MTGAKDVRQRMSRREEKGQESYGICISFSRCWAITGGYKQHGLMGTLGRVAGASPGVAIGAEGD